MSEYLFQQDVEAFQYLVFDLNTSSGVKKKIFLNSLFQLSKFM